MNAKLECLIKVKEFFNQDACPTCGQDIDHAMKMGVQSRVQKEMEEVDAATIKASKLMSEQQEKVDQYNELNNTLLKFTNQQFELETEMKGYRKVIKNTNTALAILRFVSKHQREYFRSQCIPICKKTIRVK